MRGMWELQGQCSEVRQGWNEPCALGGFEASKRKKDPEGVGAQRSSMLRLPKTLEQHRRKGGSGGAKIQQVSKTKKRSQLQISATRGPTQVHQRRPPTRARAKFTPKVCVLSSITLYKSRSITLKPVVFVMTSLFGCLVYEPYKTLPGDVSSQFRHPESFAGRKITHLKNSECKLLRTGI